jgi:predicted transglutaminase-like cysteine proteinase
MVWVGIIFLVIFAENISGRTNFDRIEQIAAKKYDERTVRTVKEWRTMIEKSLPAPAQTKIKLANDFVNARIGYESDMMIWGVEDYWTTPLELFSKRAGDCEDYAIAKYITLLLMEIPVQKLRLVYARVSLGSRTQAHMVLSYYETPTSEPFILDNLTDKIFSAGDRPDLFPVFSFNHEGLWMEGEKSSSGDPKSRLSRWRDVIQRMRSEGFDPVLTTLSARSLLSWKRAKHRQAYTASPLRTWGNAVAKSLKSLKKKPHPHSKKFTKQKTKTAKSPPLPLRKIVR